MNKENKLVEIPEWYAKYIEEEFRYKGRDRGQQVYVLWHLQYEARTTLGKDYFKDEEIEWLYKNKEKATRAILDGYTVEKPKVAPKFHVVIGVPDQVLYIADYDLEKRIFTFVVTDRDHELTKQVEGAFLFYNLEDANRVLNEFPTGSQILTVIPSDREDEWESVNDYA